MHIDDTQFTCPHAACRRRLRLQFGTKGSLKNRYYLACFEVDHHPRGTNFWHLFRLGESPQRKQVSPAARRSSALSVSSSASSLASSSSSAPSSDASTSTSTSTSSCSENICGRRRVHQHCERQMCKAHCEENGGCRTHPLPTPAPTTSLPPLNSAAVEILASIATLPYAHLQTIVSAAQEKAHALALRTPLPPSPTLSEEQEYSALLAGSPPPASANASVDFTTIHRIVLVFWATKDAPATVQAIQDPPVWRKSWPLIRLSDINNLLKTRSHPYIDPFYECWSTQYERWMKIPVSYVHTVRQDQTLLVRRLGVVGSDEDHYKSRALTQPDTPMLQRSRKGKEKAIEVLEVADSSDDEEIEVSEVTKAIKREPPTPPSRAVKRARTSRASSTPTAGPSSLRLLSPSPAPYFPAHLYDSLYTMDSDSD
ncbi:hypothetical protein DFH06DRAFT_1395561 [Mycena polygramma]|nr:hypothetical protein DFH06DRAFT_1395561 [Mycena polygramma]